MGAPHVAAVNFDETPVPETAGPPPSERAIEDEYSNLTPEQELALLFPETVKVKVRELVKLAGADGVQVKRRRVRELLIQPKTMYELSEFTAPLERIANKIGDEERLAKIITANRDDMIEAVAVGADVPPDVIGNLLPGDFTRVLVAVVQVNADFFVDALPSLAPKLQRMGAVIMARLALAGVTPTFFSPQMESLIRGDSLQAPSTSSSPAPIDENTDSAPGT